MPSQRRSPRILQIGAAGGRVKPSTGYTFIRTIEQVRHLATSLVQDGVPVTLPAVHPRFRFYDRVFLRLLEERPELASDVFLRLFADNCPDRVLRFLSERTSALEEAWILSALPFAPFVEMLAPRRRLTRPEAASSS